MRSRILTIMAVTLMALVVFPLERGPSLTAAPTPSESFRVGTGNPFGFATRMPPDQYGYCQKDRDLSDYPDEYYWCRSAPVPHPDVQRYHLRFVEDVGLCGILALTQGETVTDPFVERLEAQLSQIYGGSHTRSTSPFPFPAQNPPRYHWLVDDHDPQVGNVTAITLFAQTDRLPGALQLHFSLTTSYQCEAVRAASRHPKPEE